MQPLAIGVQLQICRWISFQKDGFTFFLHVYDFLYNYAFFIERDKQVMIG